ncbi:MAG TPA: hypothetical protein VFM46_09740 [Pseudomonadales bacterium]|nr:hypothetical protein [Pseudomonadales bacterium]
MTDRVNGLFVTLSEDMREDDAKPLIDAICRLRGVAAVGVRVTEFSDTIAQIRVRNELSSKLLDVLHPKAKD